MIRVFSALVLLPIVIGTIWLLPPVATLVLAEAALLLTFLEYARLAGRLGARVCRPAAGAAAVLVCAAVAWPGPGADAVLMAATVVIATLALAGGRGGGDALLDVSASLFPALYLALPLGALSALRFTLGPEPLVLLLATIVASDSAQYYTGRLAGRTPLAPAISPKKTAEGAIGGLVAGTAVLAVLGRWWLPPLPVPALAALGATVVLFGIAGDLFESLLKRSAGVKDASGLIPGHGGMLDRIDSLLFAAPVYYVVLLYV